MDEQTPIFTIPIGDSPLPFLADYGFVPHARSKDGPGRVWRVHHPINRP